MTRPDIDTIDDYQKIHDRQPPHLGWAEDACCCCWISVNGCCPICHKTPFCGACRVPMTPMAASSHRFAELAHDYWYCENDFCEANNPISYWHRYRGRYFSSRDLNPQQQMRARTLNEYKALIRGMYDGDLRGHTFGREEHDHNCIAEAVRYTDGDGPIGHGFECGRCHKFLQAG